MSDIRVFRTAVLSAASSGDNTLIAANSTRAIKVWKIWFTTAAAVNVTFKAGSSALSDPMIFGGNGSIFFPYDGAPYFYIPPNTGFVANLSGAVALGGAIYYTFE